MIDTFFDHNTLLSIGINLVLVGAGWGKLYTQVREVIKWKEDKEKIIVQLQTGLIQQIEVFDQFNKHFGRHDEQIKDLTREPVELALSKFENRFAADMRNSYVNKQTSDLQFELVKQATFQLDNRVSWNADHVRMILDKIIDDKISKH